MKAKNCLLLGMAILTGIAIVILLTLILDPEPLGSITRASAPEPPAAPVIFASGPTPPYASEALSAAPYPVRPGEPTEICARILNLDPSLIYTPTIELGVGNFGIGMPTHLIYSKGVPVPPRGERRFCIMWVPPYGGNFLVAARMSLVGYEDQFALRALDIDEPLQPDTPHKYPFPVHNSRTVATSFELKTNQHWPGWRVSLSETSLSMMRPEETRVVTLTVTPDSTLPPGETPVVDVEAFIGQELYGGFRKVYRPPVLLHRFPDPIYAESELTIQPYPPRAGEPTELCASLQNTTDHEQVGELNFSWAPFGIGLPFNPIGGWRPVVLPPRSQVNSCILWVPPMGGPFCLQAELALPEHINQISQRNIDIDEPLQPLTPHSRDFLVFNKFTQPMTFTLGLVPHLPGWRLELSEDVLKAIPQHGMRLVTLTVTPPQEMPPDGQPVVDVEAFAEGELIGGFRKIYRPPVPVHRPRDPIYAESEIGVDPYPVLPGQPVHLSVELHNPTDGDQVLTTTFSVAHQFGIGTPFLTAGISPNNIPVFIPAHGAATAHAVWSPPPGFFGKFCVQVTIELPGHEPIWSQRNIDVGEPLEPGQRHRLEFPVSSGEASETVTLTLGLVSHRPEWEMSLEPSQVRLRPGEDIIASLVVTPTRDAQLGAGGPIADVEAFVDRQLIGGFRKLDVPPVALHKPHEKGYAESELQVDPYPPQLGRTSIVSATVQNTSDQQMTVDLEFGWAQFGMGIAFSNAGMSPISRTVQIDPGQAKTVGVAWTPQFSGHQCVRVLLHDREGRYEPQESQRNVEVVERTYCGEHVYHFTVSNDMSTAVTVSIGSITFNVPSDWEVSVDPSGDVLIGPNTSVAVTVTVRIPCPPLASALAPAQEQQPGEGLPTVNVEGVVEGELLGGIQIQFSGEVELPKIYLPVVKR